MAGRSNRQSGFFLFNFSQLWYKLQYAPLILLKKRFCTRAFQSALSAHQR